MHFMMNSTLHVNQKVNSIQSQVGMIDYLMCLLLFQIMLCINNLSKLRSFSYLYKKTSMRLSASSSITFNSSMKKLIDSKQYRKALDLFECEPQLRTDNSVNMAIKACTELHDYERGKTIIKQLSADSFSNQFTQISLLQFYIKLFVSYILDDLENQRHCKRFFHININVFFHLIQFDVFDAILFLSTMQ